MCCFKHVSNANTQESLLSKLAYVKTGGRTAASLPGTCVLEVCACVVCSHAGFNGHR